MQKIILITLFILTASLAYSQNNSDYSGMWEIIGQSSGVPGAKVIPTYLSLKADAFYIFGIDSSKSDPLETISKGKWEITSENEIRLVPENTKMETRYFRQQGTSGIYEYIFYDKDGIKTPIYMLESSLSIRKVLDIK